MIRIISKTVFLEVGVKAFIRNAKGEYLILKRARPYPHSTIKRWDIPGGRIIPGEELEKAFRREIKEETGLSKLVIADILTTQDILRISGKHTVRITYLATCENPGKIMLLPQEHTNYQWVRLHTLKCLHHDIFLDG